ncbi:PREDICTED: uncharacterized protein LOC104779126 [Camelina sativa]|uniref:Uncharacterized protein LOC104779126 n=1 Tax=Camelina sativa TaxID=90675 RepID=A0ABM0YJ99_CAMSA|nr:PREDICTED: uncharacterized protein LOC104779126 [Camelina sativa]
MVVRHDPYLFPSNIHVASSVTIKLSNTNNLLWKTQFESLLHSQKLLGFVNGQILAPAATRFTTINNVQVTSSNAEYEARSVNVFRDKSFSVYCREFRVVCDNFSLIGKHVNESMKVVLFLNGLAREYDPIATVIQSSLSRLPSPTFNDVVIKDVILMVVVEVAKATTPLEAEDSLNKLTTQVGTHLSLEDHPMLSDDVPQALAALQVSDGGREWVTDSEIVMVADGTHLPINHIGSTVLMTNAGSLPLLDVLVCPSMQQSLVSVSKVCDDYPCGVFFDVNVVYVIDLRTQKVVTKGPHHKTLYMLENQEFVASFSNWQCAASDMVWHQRLVHANFQVLQLLKNRKAISIN